MDRNDDTSSRDLAPDALVEILVRLAPNARRRLRLVCRHWRELVDERTATDMRRRTKMIVVDKGGFTSVVDLLKPGWARRLLWPTTYTDTALLHSMMSIVGTCNGLVCLCNDLKPGGAITVVNPATSETLCLPPLPMRSADLYKNSKRRWHQMYAFTYHHIHRTGRYKVVHVPGHFERFWQPGIVHVFTLGESSWRDVHTETDVGCRLGDNSLADVDDTVYWVTEEAGKIMSFELQHERVTRIKPLPVPAMPRTCRLTKVHGRLGVAVYGDDFLTVWVLEGESWSRRYMLEAHGPRQHSWMMTWDLVGPHFVHGDYFLALKHDSSTGVLVLYRHTMSQAARSQDGVPQIRRKDRGQVLAHLQSSIHQTFAYIETKEPLSVYNAVLVHK